MKIPNIKKGEIMKKMIFLLGFFFLMNGTTVYGQEVVLATQLWKDFRTNEFAFENKYIGKKIVIRGEAFSIQRNMRGKPTLTFKAGGLSLFNASFPSSMPRHLVKLTQEMMLGFRVITKKKFSHHFFL
jgi:hypothetical protein